MPTPDPRIDAYLAQAAPFARPILAELRARIHAVCPEAEETLKWKAPAFTYRGKLLAVMAAFKGHVAFNLWHGTQVMETATQEALGQFGRLTTPKDLPSRKAFGAPVKAAMALIESGAPTGAGKAAPKPPVAPPEDLRAALAGNPAARATFEGFPPGKQRDYVDWILEAKRPDTRQRRIEQAVAWLAEGKARNWKYETC
ncbi:MAG: hypothetical protein BWY56_01492 [Acidobacteria bacterium ADurb.Bin340]|nr:MAG: hypothetical protein BWY56_01492 [Acidobacteria bacterium ADurb.Bin340]